MIFIQVKTEGNVEIINVPYNTKITINDALRKDSGVYKILAENASGKDEATVEVTILSKYISFVKCSTLFPCTQ